MIAIERGDPPAILQQLGQNLQIAIAELNQLKNDPTATPQQIKKAKAKLEQAQGKYAHKYIKQALRHLFYEKCAYCESKITDVSYGDIEHFRPKSSYIDYSFEWSNLLLSCSVCNTNKGTKFPLDSNGNPLLLNPTEENINIEAHLKFRWDSNAKLASIYWHDKCGEKTVDVFDLNRKDLFKARSKNIELLCYILKCAKEGYRYEEAMEILQEALQPNVEYLAFTRKYIEPELTKLMGETHT